MLILDQRREQTGIEECLSLIGQTMGSCTYLGRYQIVSRKVQQCRDFRRVERHDDTGFANNNGRNMRRSLGRWDRFGRIQQARHSIVSC